MCAEHASWVRCEAGTHTRVMCGCILTALFSLPLCSCYRLLALTGSECACDSLPTAPRARMCMQHRVFIAPAHRHPRTLRPPPPPPPQHRPPPPQLGAGRSQAPAPGCSGSSPSSSGGTCGPQTPWGPPSQSRCSAARCRTAAAPDPWSRRPGRTRHQRPRPRSALPHGASARR